MRQFAARRSAILGLLPLLFLSISAPVDATVTWVFSGSLDGLPDNPLPAGTPFALSLEIDETSTPILTNGGNTARYRDAPISRYSFDIGDGAIVRTQTVPAAQFNTIVLAFDDPSAGPFPNTQEAQMYVVVDRPELSLSVHVLLLADSPILDVVPLPSQQSDLPPFDAWNVDIAGEPSVSVRHEPLDALEHVRLGERSGVVHRARAFDGNSALVGARRPRSGASQPSRTMSAHPMNGRLSAARQHELCSSHDVSGGGGNRMNSEPVTAIE